MAFAYVISAAPDRHKVGVSSRPEQRLRDLQTAHHAPLRLICTVEAKDAVAVERLAHGMLRAQHLQGEWFAVSERHAVEALRLAHRALEAPRVAFEVGQTLLCVSPGLDERVGLVPGTSYVVERVHTSGHVDLLGGESGLSGLCFDPQPRAIMLFGCPLVLGAHNDRSDDIGDVV